MTEMITASAFFFAVIDRPYTQSLNARVKAVIRSDVLSNTRSGIFRDGGLDRRAGMVTVHESLFFYPGVYDQVSHYPFFFPYDYIDTSTRPPAKVYTTSDITKWSTWYGTAVAAVKVSFRDMSVFNRLLCTPLTNAR